jgi:hypothetical protein
MNNTIRVIKNDTTMIPINSSMIILTWNVSLLFLLILFDIFFFFLSKSSSSNTRLSYQSKRIYI